MKVAMTAIKYGGAVKRRVIIRSIYKVSTTEGKESVTLAATTRNEKHPVSNQTCKSTKASFKVNANMLMVL